MAFSLLVLSPDLRAAVAMEKVRLVWEYNSRETEIHRQRLLQVFVLLVGVALTTVASVVLERFPALPGLGFAAVMLLGAGVTQIQMTRLPRRLRRALGVGLARLDNLMRKGIG